MTLEALRRALARALASAAHADRSDERLGAEVTGAIDRCFDGWLADAEAGRPIPEAEIAEVAATFELEQRHEVPFELVRLEWLTRRYPRALWLDPATGKVRPGLPAAAAEGEPVVAVIAARQLAARARELGRRLFRLRHPDGCDCAEQRARGRDYDEPNTLGLRTIGPSTDAYYLGDEVACTVCGARWNRLTSDDDLGATFWDLSTGAA